MKAKLHIEFDVEVADYNPIGVEDSLELEHIARLLINDIDGIAAKNIRVDVVSRNGVQT